MKQIHAPILVLLMLAAGGVARAGGAESAGDVERLIPWPSLQGKPHPDEAGLEAADWTTVARQSLPPRAVRTINRDWTFNYFPAEQLDPATVTPGADDSRWPAVALPHTWSTFETTREVHPFIARPSERMSKYWWYGWGVYRKTFALDPKAVAGRRVFIEFDGVMKYCRVWLNGKELGDHKGGYGSFSFDLTPDLSAGEQRASGRRQQPPRRRVPARRR